MTTAPYRENANARAMLDDLHRRCAERPTDENILELRKMAIRHGIYSPKTIANGARSLWPMGWCEVCGYGPLIQGKDGREVILSQDLGHVHVCYECEIAAGTIDRQGYGNWRDWIRLECQASRVWV